MVFSDLLVERCQQFAVSLWQNSVQGGFRFLLICWHLWWPSGLQQLRLVEKIVPCWWECCAGERYSLKCWCQTGRRVTPHRSWGSWDFISSSRVLYLWGDAALFDSEKIQWYEPGLFCSNSYPYMRGVWGGMRLTAFGLKLNWIWTLKRCCCDLNPH